MLAINRFSTDDPERFQKEAAPALEAFARCRGYLRGGVARAVDEPETWVLWTEWDNIGDYRRSLSSYDVKMSTPLLSQALPEAVGFETLVTCEPGSSSTVTTSDHSPDTIGRSDQP
ncbi:hypothetical protein [Haloglycomyces albus]|uniref:hypothetical protein n=1 Tax=Haloglycomyces albus TaxID=526067 RepID=UPI00046D7453|nr:hypothetical protein [Haloglycomyces albus]